MVRPLVKLDSPLRGRRRGLHNHVETMVQIAEGFTQLLCTCLYVKKKDDCAFVYLSKKGVAFLEGKIFPSD